MGSLPYFYRIWGHFLGRKNAGGSCEDDSELLWGWYRKRGHFLEKRNAGAAVKTIPGFYGARIGKGVIFLGEQKNAGGSCKDDSRLV